MGNPRQLTIEEKKQKALDIILGSVSDEIKEWLTGVTDPAVAWKMLEDRYGPDTSARKAVLYKSLRTLRMREGEDVNAFMSKFLKLRNELGDNGVTVPEEELVELLFCALPRSWDSFGATCSAQGINLTENVTLDDMHRKMLDYMSSRELMTSNGNGHR